MSSPTREHLLGYVLGALDPTERAAIERDLADDPELLADLHRLEARIGRIGLADEPEMFDPPAGLAARTCHFVALKAEQLVAPARPIFSTPPVGEFVPTRRYSWADFVVVASVLVAGFALFFPALSHSRFQSQIAVCQNHMRQIGMALHEHATLDPRHWFPRIDSAGNRSVAGTYAPVLVGEGLLLDPRMFVCPTSELARYPQRLQIPSLEELDAATGEQLALYQQYMGGDYGYNMGYVQDQELVPHRDQRRSNHVLLGDAPQDGRPGRTSANHLGRGQSYLYEDGRVEWLETLPPQCDDPFHNRRGEVAAGCDRDDSVLGASNDRPLPTRLIKE
jgi:hypothetical protein